MKASDIKRKMSDEEFDQEMDELKEGLSMVSMLLQKMENGDERIGWNHKKKIRWPIRKLDSKKLRHRMRVLLKGKEVRFSKYDEAKRAHYCELE